MTQNPYESPQVPLSQSPRDGDRRELARQALTAPAICLMVVGGISIAALCITVPFNIFLLTSGLAQELDRGGIDPSTRIVVRTLWSCLILAASIFTVWGAVQMKHLKNFRMARIAAIVAAIPFVGPCCLIGIPFGIWALLVLGRPEVRSSFDS